jgi:ATP-dependent Lhr-like helicase
VAAHHGSLAKELRLDAEQRLKRGELQVLIATASLELGIDIGEVDLVCQIASPRSIAFLQRVGRSGHQVGGTPKGRLFATTRDDLIECAALLDCVRRGELDTLHIPEAAGRAGPADHRRSQLPGMAGRRAAGAVPPASPYAALDEKHYQALLRMLAEGYNGRQGIRSAYLHRDAVSRTCAAAVAPADRRDQRRHHPRQRRLQRVAGTAGPEHRQRQRRLRGGKHRRRCLPAGQYLLPHPAGRAGKVRVEDAQGQPPTIPFWLGEAPGRSDELSAPWRACKRNSTSCSAPRRRSATGLDWLTATLGLNASAEQLVDYLARARQALGALPSQDTLVMERFSMSPAAPN